MVYFDISLNHSQHSLISVEAATKKKQLHEEAVIRRQACPCLRFSLENNDVVIIPHHEDFTQEEKAAAYYTSSELSQMKRNARTISRWLVKNECDKDPREPEFSIRGLESMVYDQVHRTKKHSRHLAAVAVFMEQEMQMSECWIDAEAIAEQYAIISKSSLERAQAQGEMDALDAQQ